MSQRSILLLAASLMSPAVTLGQSALPAPRFFDSDGVRIAYIDRGEGVPVVLIHGIAVSAVLNWGGNGIIDSLAGKHRVIALDLRGHGLSGKPHVDTAYGERMVEDVVNLLDHLHIERAHVVGYSLGGVITMKLLTTHPDRIVSAVVGGAGWRPPGTPRPPVITEWLAGFERAAREGTDVYDVVKRPEWPVPPKAVAAINRNDPLALASVIRGDDGLRVGEAALRRNTVPVLALVGADDDIARADVEATQRVMTNLTVRIIPGVNHVTAISHPQFLREIVAFIDAHAPRSHGVQVDRFAPSRPGLPDR